MLPSTQDRRHQRNSFHVYYVDLCKRRGLVPLPGVRAHRERSCLDINGDRVNFDHWGPILNALSLDRSLHFIAIRSKQFGKKLLNDVNTELKAHAVTKSPVIYTRYVLTLLLDAVSECLFKTRTLASIEIEGLPLTKEYIVIITSALKQCPTLQNISFHRSEIGDEGCEVLCSDIKNVPNIVSLDLSHCKVSKMGARAIADLLKYQKIHRMSECWKHTLRYREPDLEAVKGIKRVTLNNNRGVGDDGVLALLEVIWDDLWLKALDLQDCGLSDRGVRSILDMLSFNTSLTIVDVQANPGVSDDLVAQVMRMLYHNNISVRPEYHWISTVNPERPKKNLTQMVANRVISQTISRSNTAKPVKRSATQTLLGRRTSQIARRPATQPAVRQSLPTRPGVPPRRIVSYSKTCLTRGHLSPGKHLRSSHHGVPMHTEQRRLKCQERTSGTPRMVELQEPYPPWYTPPPPSSAGESPQPRPSTYHVEELEKLIKESREERDKVLAERDQINTEKDKVVANLQAEVSRLILERDEALRGQQQLLQIVQQYEVNKEGCVLVEEAMLATLQATFEDLCRAYPFVTTGKKSSGSTDLHSKKQKVAEFFERVCPDPQPVTHRTKKSHSSPAHGRSSHLNVEDQNPRIDLSKVSRSACLFRESARNQPCHLDMPYMVGTISSSSDLDSLISDVSANKNLSATNLAGTDKKAPKLLSLPRNVTKSTPNNYFSTDEVDSDNLNRITTLQDQLQGEVKSMKHNIFEDYLKRDDGETEKSYDSLGYDTYFKPFPLETSQGKKMVHKEMYGHRSMGVSMPSQSKSDMSMELNIKPNKYISRTQQKSLGNESNIDKSSPNQSWSIFSKSSTSQRQYSTDDDSY